MSEESIATACVLALVKALIMSITCSLIVNQCLTWVYYYIFDIKSNV